MEDKTVGEIQKYKDKKVKVRLCNFKGWRVDIREFVIRADGVEQFTAKGVSLPISYLSVLSGLIEQAKTESKELVDDE